MALTHTTPSRNAVADACVDLVDAGVADPQGDLVFMTVGDVNVALLNMSNPAFGSAAIGVATAAAIADDPSAAGGTIAKFKLQDRDNAEILQGSVTATGGGGDIELSSVVIAATDSVAMTSLSYAAPI